MQESQQRGERSVVLAAEGATGGEEEHVVEADRDEGCEAEDGAALCSARASQRGIDFVGEQPGRREAYAACSTARQGT